MIKIELPGEVEDKHIQYFENNIVPQITDCTKNCFHILDSCKPIKFTEKDWLQYKEKFKIQQNGFAEFVKNNYKIFAVGKSKDLKNLNEKLEMTFPLVKKMIDSECKNEKNQTYCDFIYKLFGFEDFKVKDLYYYIKKKAQENTKKNSYCKEVRDEIVKFLKDNYTDLNKEINNKLLPSGQYLYAKEFEKEFRRLPKINITMDNFKKIDIFKEEWNDYAFIMESGLRVCPYCNRQYITPVFSDNGKMRADIDHFLPKNKYPYFSMSLYNLVPVCKSCNQSLKGSKEFEFDDLNPYDYSLNDYFSFKVDTVCNEILIDGINIKNKEIEKHLNTFKIEALYNYHRNQVEELIMKRIAYPESYIEKIYNENEQYFNDINDVKQLIIGYIKDKSKLNDEAFLKLRRDIAKQLGFLDGKINEKQVEKLKSILNKRKKSDV